LHVKGYFVAKVTTEDLWDVENKRPVRDLLEDIHAEPFPEFHCVLLMTGGTEMTELFLKSLASSYKI
jgi:hypothetical protein